MVDRHSVDLSANIQLHYYICVEKIIINSFCNNIKSKPTVFVFLCYLPQFTMWLNIFESLLQM